MFPIWFWFLFVFIIITATALVCLLRTSRRRPTAAVNALDSAGDGSIQGSWFQRFWARSREIAESEPMRTRMAKLERAVELEQLGKRQAEIDKAKAEALAAMCPVVQQQKNAVIRMGTMILIKTADDLVIWTIGEMEAAEMEKHRELLRDPMVALTFLRSDAPSLAPDDTSAKGRAAS